MSFAIAFDSSTDSDGIPTIPTGHSLREEEESDSTDSTALPIPDSEPQPLPGPALGTESEPQSDPEPTPAVEPPHAVPCAPAPSAPSPPLEVRYNCRRIAGVARPTTFSLTNRSEGLYAAKFRGGDAICICPGAEIHLSTSAISHLIRISLSKKRKFQLFEESAPLAQRGFLEFTEVSPTRPRNLALQWANPPLSLMNLQPVFNPQRMRWQLNFDGHYAVRSRKNAVLVTEDSVPMALVRKITKDDLELEAVASIDPLLVFFLAIGSFVCRL
jgi:hypothetical protein